MKSFVNSWNIYLERGEFFIIIYPKIGHVNIHLHVGSFDKMLSVSNFGIHFV